MRHGPPAGQVVGVMSCHGQVQPALSVAGLLGKVCPGFGVRRRPIGQAPSPAVCGASAAREGEACAAGYNGPSCSPGPFPLPLVLSPVLCWSPPAAISSVSHSQTFEMGAQGSPCGLLGGGRVLGGSTLVPSHPGEAWLGAQHPGTPSPTEQKGKNDLLLAQDPTGVCRNLPPWEGAQPSS